MRRNRSSKGSVSSYGVSLAVFVLSAIVLYQLHAGHSLTSRQNGRRTLPRADLVRVRPILANEHYYHNRPSLASQLTTPTRKDATTAHAVAKAASIRNDVSELVAIDEIIKSPNDLRDFRLVQLENGLEVLLVSDMEADSSAAAMAIKCGSWCDPKEVPGLAHFLEHMLFLGTKKYPSENDFASYLNEHGGQDNAYTASTDTVFFFNIDAEHLKGGLDRFAQFFISPLFNPSATDREINAIDSEHKQYLQSDSRRLFELIKRLANQEHPFTQFATGDKSTLLREDIREYLNKFYEKYYSANQMRLTIVGREPVDTLEQWAKEIFTEVPNRNVPSPTFPVEGSVFPQSGQKQEMKVLPISEDNSVLLIWPTKVNPDKLYRESPSGLINYYLGNELEKSLISTLRDKDWVYSLGGNFYVSSDDLNIYTLGIDLTDEGVKHMDEVIKSIYEYLGLIREKGIEKNTYDELVALRESDFRFKEKGDPTDLASGLAGRLLEDRDPSDLLDPPSRLRWAPEYTHQLLNDISPRNMSVLLLSKLPFENGEIKETDVKTEKWYGTQYTQEKLNDKRISKWESAFESGWKKSKLKLPPKNPYITKNFGLIQTPLSPQERQSVQARDANGLWNPPEPALVSNDSSLTLWHSNDAIKEFPVPRAQCYTIMRSTRAPDAEEYVKTDFYLDMVGEKITEKLQAAGYAGYHVTFSNAHRAFVAAAMGWSENLKLLLQESLDLLKSAELSETRFQSIKEDTMKTYDNFFKQQPYSIGRYYLNLATMPDYFAIEDLKEAAMKTKFKDVIDFIPTYFSSEFSQETFVHGNVDVEEGKSWAKLFREKLQPTNLNATISTPNQQQLQYDIGKGKSWTIIEKLKNPEEKNSATIVNIQLGDRGEMSVSDLAKINLLGFMIGEPAFDELRTKQQLGYIVSAATDQAFNTFTLQVLVQGAEHSAEYYDGQIEKFLISNFPDFLNSVSDEQFEKYKGSLEQAYLRRDLNLQERSRRYWDPIAKQLYDFNWRASRIEALRELKKDDLLNFYKEKVTDPKTRRRLSVRMVSESEVDRKVTAYPVESVPIDDIKQFRSGLSQFSA
mmetsp:Transcript_8737/g.13052  ORF Transcript_8737/g.13052 Transcript_8737/m.13052 type:complete len:1078 (-) Transcript_8737:171-3404(-)